MKFNIEGGLETTTALVQRMMYLAWKACRGPVGMGVFQDRGPNQTEEQVWEAMYNRKDYPGGNDIPGFANRQNRVHADYVMGRMMKVGFQWDEKSITFSSSDWRSDYQAFCVEYPDPKSLLRAAEEDLKLSPSTV